MPPETPRQLPQAPPIFTRTPASIVDDAKRLIERSREVQDQVVNDVRPDTAAFANVLLPLANSENALSLEANILGFFKAVSPDSKLRDASSKAQELFDDFSIETSMREDLYRLVDAVLKRNEDLDQESYQLLVKSHKNYIRNGLDLPVGPKRDRFKEIKRRLSQLKLEFRQNIVEENGGIWFFPRELEGLPKDLLSGLEKGENKNEGMLRLTFQYPDFYPAMRYAKNAETRKRIYIANDNKCNQNVPLFKEIIVLRDEAARLLGYPNHAAFRLEDKMAKTPETVNNFLGDLRSRLTTYVVEEVENLKQLKESDLATRGEVSDGRFLSWDLTFYNRLMLETQYSVDQKKIAEYFPLPTTIRGMLEILQHLFGLVFVEIVGIERNMMATSGKGSDLVWHEDVQMFSVWNEDKQGSDFLGYLYLDLFPREGKYRNASNFNLCPGFLRENGMRQYPVTALVCSFSKPTSDKPSLLIHREVVTLFHELGHAIHDLVSKTTYSRFHGTKTVIDFGEAPSQMLENWCWDPSSLKSLSTHYSSLSEYSEAWEHQTEEKPNPPKMIPDEMIESLLAAKHVNGAVSNLSQLHLGIFDMMVHEPETHEAIENSNISAIYNTLRSELMHIDGPETLGLGNEWGHGQASFGHLMGDYDVGYYGYLSSQVYSADMFYTAFKNDPMSTQEGLRYRYKILEKGGSQDEMQTLIEFLGRKPKTEAFYRELGLA